VGITMVTLRTGRIVPEPALVTTLISLEEVAHNPIAFFEIVSLARDPSHRMFGNTKEIAERFGLIDSNNTMHEIVRDIILAATDGEDFALHLVDPR
jgi:hypothetical protein